MQRPSLEARSHLERKCPKVTKATRFLSLLLHDEGDWSQPIFVTALVMLHLTRKDEARLRRHIPPKHLDTAREVLFQARDNNKKSKNRLSPSLASHENVNSKWGGRSSRTAHFCHSRRECKRAFTASHFKIGAWEAYWGQYKQSYENTKDLGPIFELSASIILPTASSHPIWLQRCVDDQCNQAKQHASDAHRLVQTHQGQNLHFCDI